MALSDEQFQPPPPRAAAQPPPPAPSGPKYIAVYDYTAADEDEISFNEGGEWAERERERERDSFSFSGDEIVDVEVIDEGWMEGRVKGTSRKGMLPSNYVEKQ